MVLAGLAVDVRRVRLELVGVVLGQVVAGRGRVVGGEVEPPGRLTSVRLVSIIQLTRYNDRE